MKLIAAMIVASSMLTCGCDRSVAQSAPTPGVYTCQSIYRDQGYSFALYNDGTYHKLKKGITNRYSYKEEEDGIIEINWQGIYKDFDASFYWEREDGEKFIVLMGKPKESQVCRLYVVK